MVGETFVPTATETEKKTTKNKVVGGAFLPTATEETKRAGKTRKRTGMTSLGSPGVSSQSVSGFFGRKGPGQPQKGLG